jgi:hypothetical protein
MVDRPKSIGQAHRVFSQMEKEIERLTTEGERKDAAILAAYDELMNLQPHIPQACKPGHGGFIDSHVDEAMRVLSSVSDNPAQVRPHTQPIEIEREPVADGREHSEFCEAWRGRVCTCDDDRRPPD